MKKILKFSLAALLALTPAAAYAHHRLSADCGCGEKCACGEHCHCPRRS